MTVQVCCDLRQKIQLFYLVSATDSFTPKSPRLAFSRETSVHIAYCFFLNEFTDGGRSSMVPASKLINSKILASIPWLGRVRDIFFCPSELTLVQTCLYMDPASCVMARTQICAHVKDPLSICRKRVGLTAGGILTHKYCIH